MLSLLALQFHVLGSNYILFFLSLSKLIVAEA